QRSTTRAQFTVDETDDERAHTRMPGADTVYSTSTAAQWSCPDSCGYGDPASFQGCTRKLRGAFLRHCSRRACIGSMLVAEGSRLSADACAVAWHGGINRVALHAGNRGEDSGGWFQRRASEYSQLRRHGAPDPDAVSRRTDRGPAAYYRRAA